MDLVSSLVTYFEKITSLLPGALEAPKLFLQIMPLRYSENQNSSAVVHSCTQSSQSPMNQKVRSRTRRLVSIAQVLEKFHALYWGSSP
jgi:hypothetical protein